MSEMFKVENPELQYKAYLSVDTLNNKMAFGGCRYAPTVTEAEVRHLSECMTLKLLPHGLPVGGAKAGFMVDPNSPRIFEIVSDFAKQMKNLLSSSVVIGKDLGATDEIMDRLYSSIGIAQLKPVHQHHPEKTLPSKIRDMTGYQKHMTGKGVAWATASFYDQDLRGKTVIIQGSGAVGVGAAFRLEALGAKVIAISDKNVCISNRAGMSFAEVSQWTANGNIQTQSLSPSVQVLDSSGLFSIAADILVLAANSHTVGTPESSRIDVDVVIEGSNFGLKPEARQNLFEKGIPVVPDVIASSSSAAMVALQMASGNSYSDEALWKKISQSIFETTQETLKIAKSEKMELRSAYQEILAPQLRKKYLKTI